MSIIVIQHSGDVGLGALAAPLAERAVDIRIVDATESASVDLGEATGLLLLGGRADDDSPSSDELDLVRRALEMELPTLGICHGAEVIALALGGTVVQRERPEVGFIPLHRTEPGTEDDIAAGWPDGAVGFAFHSREIASLPGDAATLLIGSDGPSMWSHGSARGTQLHLEADAETILTWLQDPANAEKVEAAGLDTAALVEETQRRGTFLASAGPAMLLRWVDGITSAR